MPLKQIILAQLSKTTAWRNGQKKIGQITKRFLVELYSLDPGRLLFRSLLFFWQRDPAGRPLLALLCVYARDGLLRSTAKYILNLSQGASVSRHSMEVFLDGLDPGRYSPAKLASNAKNLNATWTQSGHLDGRVRKVRSRANPTAGNVSYALLLGYLTGVRGQALFQTEYTKLLDCPSTRPPSLPKRPLAKGGLLSSNVLGDVIEVLFPNLINQEEMEWLREQS